MTPFYKPGEPIRLPDGRIITFLEIKNPDTLDDPCYGCVLQDERCTETMEFAGNCSGMDREDGKWGIFVDYLKLQKFRSSYSRFRKIVQNVH